MDVHCSTCDEPWDIDHLRHEEIFETDLSHEETKSWLELSRAEQLNDHYPSVPISLETLSSNSLMSRAKEIFNVSRLVIIKARESITHKG